MVGSSQADVLGDFYEKILGKPTMAEEGWRGWLVGSSFVSIAPHSEVKSIPVKEPSRIILNFETEDVKGEFERIKALGAKVVKESYEMQGMWIATFADPDGNYFQLMSPWKGN